MLKPLYDPTIFCNELESIDQEKYIIATLYFENTMPEGQFIDHLAMVQRAGLLGATGAWMDIKGESPEVRQRLCFKIIGYYELPHSGNVRKAVVQFAENSEYQLVETLAEAVAEMVIRDFSVSALKLTLSKAGAVSQARDVGVEIERQRGDFGA